MKQEIKITGSTGQQKSIICGKEPIKRVIACPGTGKTYVLTQSIAEIINNGFCQPQEILAITFTKNAAENMRQRISGFLNKKIDYDVWMTALKTGTYFLIGTISATVIQFIQGGYDLKNSLVLGVGVGLIAGIKNTVKHIYGIDMDLTQLKK